MIIEYKKFDLTIKTREELVLPYYKGSTFRGGFGNVFKRVVCTLKDKNCNDCLLKTKCVYAYVFETSPPEGVDILNMSKYERIPHPFVIEPPLENERLYEPGKLLQFKLVLIGRAVDYLPYFIYTFEELGRTGIGRGRGKFAVLNVSCNNKILYQGEEKDLKITPADKIRLPLSVDMNSGREDSLKICFKTPVRIVHKRRLVSDLQFHILLKNLLRRLTLLYNFHCNPQPVDLDLKGILEESENVETKENCLKWWDWERYSSRQNARMKMGGLIGEIIYKGNIKAFLPFLKCCEIVHVGKGTSFGLGCYELS